ADRGGVEPEFQQAVGLIGDVGDVGIVPGPVVGVEQKDLLGIFGAGEGGVVSGGQVRQPREVLPGSGRQTGPDGLNIAAPLGDVELAAGDGNSGRLLVDGADLGGRGRAQIVHKENAAVAGVAFGQGAPEPELSAVVGDDVSGVVRNAGRRGGL